MTREKERISTHPSLSLCTPLYSSLPPRLSIPLVLFTPFPSFSFISSYRLIKFYLIVDTPPFPYCHIPPHLCPNKVRTCSFYSLAIKLLTPLFQLFPLISSDCQDKASTILMISPFTELVLQILAIFACPTAHYARRRQFRIQHPTEW